MQKKLLHWLFTLLPVIALTLFLFRPYFFENKVPFSANLLPSFYEPWMSYPRPEYPNGPANKPMGFDAVRIFYPLRELSTELIKHGQFPLWNPYNFAGNTLLGTYQSAIFHPMSWIFFILPQIDAWSIVILLTPILSFIFMYLFLRQLTIPKFGSVFGAITFAFSGFMIVWWEESFMASYTAILLPLILLGIEKVRNKSSPFSFFLLTCSLVMSITAGWFQFTLYAWAFSGVWILFRLFTKKLTVKKLFWIVAAYLIALAISAIHLFPGMEALAHSARSSTDAKYLFDAYLLPLGNLITFLAPDFFGNPGTYNYFGKGFYYERMLYIGIPALFFIFYQVANWKRHIKEERFFLIVFFVTLSLGLALPTSWFLLYTLKLPLLSVIIPSRIFFLSTFAASALAAFGMTKWREQKEKAPAIIATFFLTLAIIASWIFVFVIKYLIGKPETKMMYESFHLFTTTSMRNLILPTLLTSATVATIWAGLLFSKRKFASILLLVISLAGSAYFAQKYLYFSDRNLVYPETPVISKLKELSGNNRFWTPEHGYIQSNFATSFRLFSPEGYDSFFIRRYGELVDSAKHEGKFNPEIPRADATISSTDTFADILKDPYRQKLLQLLGIKYIARKNISERHGPIDVTIDPHLKLVWNDTAFQIFEYADALPRAFLVTDYLVKTSEQQILEAIFDPKTDLSKTIILEEQPSVQNLAANGTAEITEYTPNKIFVKVRTPSDTLLFLSDNYYPGWIARVDGKETKIYRANYAFRAVVVPTGTHEVIFSYEPKSVKIGLWITIGGILTLILFSLKLRHRGFFPHHTRSI